MNDVFEDEFERIFNLIKYYLQQAKWRNSKSYIEIAATYCIDVLKNENVSEQVRAKALSLRGICYLMLGNGEDSDIKETCFIEAFTLFLKLPTFSLNSELFSEFNISESLFDEFFYWSHSRSDDKMTIVM